jgi:hypothetical protein
LRAAKLEAKECRQDRRLFEEVVGSSREGALDALGRGIPSDDDDLRSWATLSCLFDQVEARIGALGPL